MRRHHAPAIGVLRKARNLAKRLAFHQMLPGVFHLAALDVESSKARVHVRASPQRWHARSDHVLQRVFVDVLSIAEAALRDTNVGQGDGNAEHVGEVSRALEPVASGGP